MDSNGISRVTLRNVAVATDFSACSERAVEHALAVARHFGATIHFLHLVRPSKFAYVPEMMPNLDEAATRDCDQLIDQLAKSHRLEGIEFHRWVEQGEIEEVVGEFVRKQQIDLLILGTHGRSGVPRLLLGSAAQQIFHSVHCPVLTVGPASPGASLHLQLRRVLFSTDLSPESLSAVPWVVTAAQEWHTELDLLHVCSHDAPEHSERLKILKARIDAAFAAQEHPSVRCHMLSGKPSIGVLGFAGRNHDDLIVLGLKPRRGLYSGPFWSHAYEIVRQAQCPVLSIRSAPAQA